MGEVRYGTSDTKTGPKKAGRKPRKAPKIRVKVVDPVHESMVPDRLDPATRAKYLSICRKYGLTVGTTWADVSRAVEGTRNQNTRRCPSTNDCKTSDWGSAGMGTGRGYGYCTGSGKTSVIPNASGMLVGTGYPNTSAMLTMCESGNAAEQVRGYTGGGMTDWSLPSQDELNALYYYGGRNAIGGFAADCYWSSSQLDWNGSWMQYFKNGHQGASLKNTVYGLRPVRAF